MPSWLEIGLSVVGIGLGAMWVWDRYQTHTFWQHQKRMREENLEKFLSKNNLTQEDLERPTQKHRWPEGDGTFKYVTNSEGKGFYLYFSQYGFSHGREELTYRLP